MIAHKKEFTGGLVMLAGFAVLFFYFLTPSFAGKNLLDFMDGLYNSISKKSAYYIPQTMEKAKRFKKVPLDVELKSKGADSDRLAHLLRTSGMEVEKKEQGLLVRGDLGVLLSAAVADADTLFANDRDTLRARYGQTARQTGFDWWTVLGLLENGLKKQEEFKKAAIVYEVQTKAVEPAYNYFGIEAQAIGEKIGIVVISLVGYVAYTLWFGFAILFMFEGWGLKLEH